MFKKWMVILSAVALLAGPAFAGNIPEFDAVGKDSANFFIDDVMKSVVDNVLDRYKNKINDFSDFVPNGSEFFNNTAGALYPDPCFPGYVSAMVDMSNSATFTWQIVLQMKPESDIDLSIRDCVLKHNTFNVWGSAEQTGRYRTDRGKLMFLLSGNPTVAVKAFPGKYKTAGFPGAGFYLNARTTPGLLPLPLNGQFYTSKALWDETIVMEMPVTGVLNGLGETQYTLKQGDKINVTVSVSEDNTADIFYGADNVVLKYIGIVGTEYSTLHY